MEPILKWAGGKRNLLPVINEIIDSSGFKSEKARYYEPFVGGGALCFDRAFANAYISDLNEELINVYVQVKDNPQKLIEELEIHADNHCKDYYLKIRALDRSDEYERLSDIQRAARIIYLNRTCYNGLYRVNRKGQFNVPMGNYKKPEIVMKDRIHSLSNYFNANNVEIKRASFEEGVMEAKEGDLVYFDPPYDYDSEGFSTYTSEGFGIQQLIALKVLADKLVDRGCIVILSNNETRNVMDLFGEDGRYEIKRVKATRCISRDGQKREKADEVIIYGKKRA